MQPLTLFVSAVITTSAAALVGLAFALVKSLIGIKKSVETLVVNDIQQTEAIKAVAKLQRPGLVAHKATLEALRDGKCNGNVTSAHEGIISAFDEYDDWLISRVAR